MKPLRCSFASCKRKARASITIPSWLSPLTYCCYEHALLVIGQGFRGCGPPATVICEWADNIFNPHAPDGDPLPLMRAASDAAVAARDARTELVDRWRAAEAELRRVPR